MFSGLSFHAVPRGLLPSGSGLKGVPTFEDIGKAKGAERGKESEDGISQEGKTNQEKDAATIAQQASTLISLLSSQSSLASSSKPPRIWLGDGLGSLPKRIHERMIKWEFMHMQDMQDFRLRSSPQTFQDGETQTLVALSGFELVQPRK